MIYCCKSTYYNVHASPKVMATFYQRQKINMVPSSDLYDFWWVHKMHASGHFLCKIYWLFALTHSAPGSKYNLEFGFVILKISLTFKRCKNLNNSSACALYLLQDIIRTALFWSLDIRQDLNPQTRIEWLIWGRIKLLNKVRNILLGRYRLSLFIIPKDLEILFAIFCICAFQIICWSMVSPRKLEFSTLTKVPHLILTLLYDSLYLVDGYGTSCILFSEHLVILYSIQATFVHFCIFFSSLFFTCERDTILTGVFCSSLYCKILWSNVAKTFDKSRKIPIGNVPLSSYLIIMSIVSSDAVSVECKVRNPYWPLFNSWFHLFNHIIV